MPEKLKPEKILIGSQEILLPNPEMQRLYFGRVVLILIRYDSLPIHQLRRNLRAYDVEGNFLWEVQPAPYYASDDPEFWSNIYRRDETVRIGCSGTDHEDYVLELSTGKVYHDSGKQVSVHADLPLPEGW